MELLLLLLPIQQPHNAAGVLLLQQQQQRLARTVAIAAGSLQHRLQMQMPAQTVLTLAW
jgi:hypothetical protein